MSATHKIVAHISLIQCSCLGNRFHVSPGEILERVNRTDYDVGRPYVTLKHSRNVNQRVYKLSVGITKLL